MQFKENRQSAAKNNSLCPMTPKVQSYPWTCLLKIHVKQLYNQQPPQTGRLTTKPLKTPHYTPCLRSPLFPLKTILEASSCQLLHCQPRRDPAVGSGGKHGSGALPGAGSSQRQSRAHIATVRSADWMRAVLNLTPGSACSLTGLPVYLAALSCFLCSS